MHAQFLNRVTGHYTPEFTVSHRFILIILAYFLGYKRSQIGCLYSRGLIHKQCIILGVMFKTHCSPLCQSLSHICGIPRTRDTYCQEWISHCEITPITLYCLELTRQLYVSLLCDYLQDTCHVHIYCKLLIYVHVTFSLETAVISFFFQPNIEFRSYVYEV